MKNILYESFMSCRNSHDDIENLFNNYFKESLVLQESVKFLNMFFDNSRDGFFFMMLEEPISWNDSVDKDKIIDNVFKSQKITKVNKAMLEQYDVDEKDFLGFTPSDFYINNISRGKRLWKELFDKGVLHLDNEITKPCGGRMVIQGDYVCLYDEQRRITGHFGVQRDITAERTSQNKIKESDMRFKQLAENIEEIFWIRENNKIIYVNSAFEKITGISEEKIKNGTASLYNLAIDEDKSVIYKSLCENPIKFDLRYRIKRPDGEIRWIWDRGSTFKCPDTNVVRSVGVSADITHMKELEEKLKITSTIDNLTQIYNRKYVFDRLDEMLMDYKRNNSKAFSFAILDIDFFKNVNDSYGHAGGDFILKEFSSLIKENIRSSDILGRYGGEEFVIVLKGTDKENARLVISKILDITRNTTFKYESKEISFTFSAGVSDSSEFPIESFSITKLMNTADDRLYKAKETGRNKIVIE